MKWNRITLVFTFAFISVLFSANSVSAVPEEDVVTTSDVEVDHQVITEAIDLMTRSCLKKGDPVALEHARAGRETFKQCVKPLVDMTIVEKELEIAKSLQDVHVVISKYCRKVPQVVECIKNFTVGVIPCLKANQTKTALDDLLANTLDAVCYNDGERLSQFFSDRGQDCFTTQLNFPRDCRDQMITNITAIKENADTELTQEQKDVLCQEIIHGLRTCMVQRLSTCEKQSAAILVDSVFNATVNSMGCGDSSNQPLALGIEL